MKRLLIVFLITPFLLTGASVSFRAEEGRINGCYQKNSGSLRMVQDEGACQASELSVSWGRTRAASRTRVKNPTYSVTTLPTLGGTENFAYAINARGEIVGASRPVGDTTTHAFVFDRQRITDINPVNSGEIQTVGPTSINDHGQVASGVMVGAVYVPVIYDSITQRITTLGSLGGVTSFGFSGVATSINNSGEAVGYSYLNELNRHGFLYRRGVIRDVGSFGGYSAAMDVNDVGIIVGFASNTLNGTAHAFLYSGGSMIDIDPFGGADFGASESYAAAVNNRGDVVGSGLIEDRTAFHAFLSRAEGAIDLGTLPGGRNSYASDVNESGLTVGTGDIPYVDTCYDQETGTWKPCTKFKQSAFLYDQNSIIDLNTLVSGDAGWDLIRAFAINDRGQIVGYGLLDGKLRGYRLDPKP